jgi:hypothetical protein
MANPMDIMPLFVLASLKAEARKRATTPLMVASMPVAAAQRGAIAAVAISNEVSDGIRRERQVASEVINVIKSDKPPTTDHLRGIPALKAIATDGLRDDLVSLRDDLEKRTAEVASQAAKVASLTLWHKRKLNADEVTDYKLFLDQLDDTARDNIINK